jgi:nucleoside diphosphate kinase
MRDHSKTKESTDAQDAIPHLKDNSVIELLASGRATLAMIRPNIESSVKRELVQNGGSAADNLEYHIQDLGMLIKFRFKFDEQGIYEFYNGKSQVNQMNRPPERDFSLSNRWEEFVGIMTSGPVTCYILTAPAGAAARWRRQIGHWDIANHADPTTLRGRFGIHNYNNLLHGSDSSEEAIREFEVILRCIKRTRESARIS